MDTCTLHMLHNTGNQDVRSIADRIHLDLLALQILVYQNGMILRDPVDDLHELFDLTVVDGDLHALSAQHIGGTNQYGIAQLVCHPLCLLGSKYRAARRSGDLALLKNLIKELSVLRCVHVLGTCAEDRHAHLHQALCQFDRGLSAELNDRAVRLLQIHDILHILRCQRLEIQLIRDIKVRADRLRIVVYDDRFVACLCKCPGRMDGTVVKFDSLSDTDRSGTEYKHLLLSAGAHCLILTAEAGIIVRRLCVELCRTCIHDLKCCRDPVVIAHFLDFIF